jgi:hypothetical protein
MPSHRYLAQHFFLDALDLHFRFRAHWDDQPRKSSRVKSFLDLMMACECLLKAQCIMARIPLPMIQAYAEVKALGHDIHKLSLSAEEVFPSPVHKRARQYFGFFSVGLRYSVDAHEYFFPVGGYQRTNRKSYGSTLGDTNWMHAAENVVSELIEWGKAEFNGEVEADIENILRTEEQLEAAVREPPLRARRKNSDA